MASAVKVGPKASPVAHSAMVSTRPNRIHFSCWRCTSEERRNRTTSELHATTTVPIVVSASGMFTASAETQSTPTGLTTPAAASAGDQDSYGANAQDSELALTTATDNANAARHRRDTSLPSGSSRGSTVPISNRLVTQAQFPNQKIDVASGAPRGRSSAHTPYSKQADITVLIAPTASDNQPIDNRGRTHTNQAPAPAKERPATSGISHQSVTPAVVGDPRLAR